MNRMKALLVSVAIVAVLPSNAARAESPTLQGDAARNGYSVGYDIGRSLRQQLDGVDVDAVARGLKDAMKGAKPAIVETEMSQRFNTVRREAMKRIPEKNLKDGEAYLAKNRTQKDVKTTASGLQYKVLKAGTGKKPAATDTVTVNYRGTLIDGTEFDSSYKRGEPATFNVSGVIPGWTEALQLMTEGSKWMLYIPSKLAYAERGGGRLIGPNSALVFEVELISIKKP